jgi:hypothetical protein
MIDGGLDVPPHNAAGRTAVEIRRCRIALAIGTLLVLWGLITHGTYAGSGDEPHYQMIAHSIAFDRDLDLSNNYGDRTNLVFGGGLTPDAHAVPGKGGSLRPVHDIGLPLLFSPYFALAYQAADASARHIPAAWLTRAKLNGPLILRHLLSLAMSVVAAWIAVQLFGWFQSMAPPRVAMGWAALLVLSPPLLSHAFLFFTEIVSAALALWAFGRLRYANPAPQAVLLGLVTGGLFLVHARNAGLIAGLLVVLMLRTWGPVQYLAAGLQSRSPTDLAPAASKSHRPTDRTLEALKSRRPAIHLIGFCVGFALALAARTAITYHFWGTWLTTPIARFGSVDNLSMLAGEALTRILGMLIDQEHGLLMYAPIYLLVPAGFCVLWRTNRELCLALTVVIAAYTTTIVLPLVNPHGWRGGWTPAGRFLVPIVPFLAIAVFAGGHALFARFRWAVVALVTVQVVLSAFLWQHPRLLWNDGDGASALLGYFDGDAGRLSSFFPSVPALLAPGTLALFGAVILVWVIGTALAAKTELDAVAAKQES